MIYDLWSVFYDLRFVFYDLNSFRTIPALWVQRWHACCSPWPPFGCSGCGVGSGRCGALPGSGARAAPRQRSGAHLALQWEAVARRGLQHMHARPVVLVAAPRLRGGVANPTTYDLRSMIYDP